MRDAETGARRKAKLYLLSLVLFAVLFGVVLVATEFTVRYLHIGGSAETRDHLIEADYMPAKNKPNYEGRIWNVPFKTNEYGLRDEENFPLLPAPGEFRIMSLGDSIAFGLGIPAREHYTKILERNLNHAGVRGRFRVVNASGPGYSPSCYYLYLKHDGLKLQPRLVILQIELCNDITDEALLRWEGTREDPSALDRVRGGRYIIGWDGNLLATFSRGPHFFEKTYTYTVLLRRVLNLMYRLNPTEPFASGEGITYYSLGFDRYLLDQARIEAGWERTFAALEKTQALVRDHGADFLLLIMPTQYMFDRGSAEYGRFARRLVERATSEARKRKLAYVDFTEAMETAGGASLYFDFAHPTVEGNQVIGRKLSEELVPRLAGVPGVWEGSDRSYRTVPSAESGR
jgi:lysophospholipase L1-like esterase